MGSRKAPPPRPRAAGCRMASLAPRVDYLARFRCPLRGLAAGKARVLCHGAEIFLSTGSELVHVYDQEARRLTVSAGRGPGCGEGRLLSRAGAFVLKLDSSRATPTPASARADGVQVSESRVAPGAPGPSQDSVHSLRREGHLLFVAGPGRPVRSGRRALGRTHHPPRGGGGPGLRRLAGSGPRPPCSALLKLPPRDLCGLLRLTLDRVQNKRSPARACGNGRLGRPPAPASSNRFLMESP